MTPPCQRAATARLGYSLVEVLVALTLLSVGLLIQAGGMAAVSRLIDRTRNAGRAATLAADRLERLRLSAGPASAPCLGPAAGGANRVGHIIVTWSTVGTGAIVSASASTSWWNGHAAIEDTLVTGMRC